MDSTETITHISLCAGYGGIDLGLHDAVPNLRTVAACEIEAFAVANMVAKMEAGLLDPAPVWTDLKTFPWEQFHGKVDILSGGYPCFAAGTLVLTERRGYIPIEQVTVGECVLTHLGNWKPVNAVMRKTGASTITIRPAHGTSIECTGEHPFLTRTRHDNNLVWVEAKHLEKHHRLGSTLPNREEYSSWSLPKWWLAGRYVADGYRHGHKIGKRVIFCVGNNKLEEFRNRLSAAELHGSEAREKGCTKVHVCRSHLYEEFGELFGDYCDGKRIPGWLLGLPLQQRRAFVDGYLSGDGSTCKRTGLRTYVSINESLMLSLGALIRSVEGFPVGIQKKKVSPTKVIEGRTVNQKPWYRGAIARGNKRGFVDGIRCWGEFKRTPGREDTTVYNLAVQDDESYHVNGVIVHNCQPFSHAGKRLGQDDPRHLWPHIRDGIGDMHPRLVFFENVEGHLSLGLDCVLNDLESLGYRVAVGLFSAAEVGLPQQRKRVFILGLMADADGKRLEGYPWDITRQGAGQRLGAGDQRGATSCRVFPPALPGQEQFWYEPPRVLANADRQREQQSEGPLSEIGGRALDGCEDCVVGNTPDQGLPLGWDGTLGGHGESESQSERSSGDYPAETERLTQLPLGRDPDGTPNRVVPTELFTSVDSRVDELRLLGNGVVPAVASLAFRTLYARLMSVTN